MSSPTSFPRAWERGLLPQLALSSAIGWAIGAGACGAPASAEPARDPGLLFYLSGTHGTEADVAAPGTRRPNFEHGVAPVADGARGPGLSCSHTQVLSYWAPGNIYAQRGTLAFFWRAREPVGPTEFPIFRVAFADHSSWDMVWSRIDYNGHGFDAFVTDANLARQRVSVTVAPFPAPERWVHLALAWDETRGIRFFVDGRLVAVQDGRALLDTGLDQLGPHSRIIAPLNVQSDYNFVRGGDIDEVRIYDRVLDDADVSALARGTPPRALAPVPARDLADARVRDQWWWRYGWNRPGDPPPYLEAPATRIRKVEIHDTYDLGRWWWKANDGIPETTWPGVYNRSSLPGRRDYFILPDWDCYSTSGRAVTFALPDEPWNAIQIAGAAWGTLRLVARAENQNQNQPGAGAGSVLFERPAGQERTFHQLDTPVTGHAVRFESAAPEQPIAELGAFLVTPGAAPTGARTLRYRLARPPAALPAELVSLGAYIDGRHPFDERARLVAVPDAQAGAATASDRAGAHPAGVSLRPTADGTPGLPLVHILIPPRAAAPGYDWSTFDDGLDGIVIDLPALGGRPTHGAFLPLNVRVKDPLWPMRDLLDFSFSVKPGEARTLWLDLRDRLLPPGRGLYLALAAAGAGGFGAGALEGATLALVFKDRAAARREHEIDRFTQLRDVYAMMVEEHPADPRFNLWNRFKGDLDDLLRVNPQHALGRLYAVAAGVPGPDPPPVTIPEPPKGVPRWAFRQVTALAGVERLVLWYIQHRQIADGELGGGLSDDTDLTNLWPGTALMGCQPERVAASLRAVLEACYASGMLVHGLPAIQTDELHGYEEGINALAQNLLLDYGSPQLLERAMETTRAVAGLTGVNRAGHRHFRTAYYSATRVAEDSVWGYDKPFMTLLLHPAFLLGDFNGNPGARRLVEELADGLVAHRHPDDTGHTVLPRAIHFASDRDAYEGRAYFPWPLFWAAWRWTGAARYLDPIYDGGLPTVLAVNGDFLDEVGVREQWRARVLAGEATTPAPNEARASGDVRRRRAGDNYRRSTTAHFAWQLTGDKRVLEDLYGKVIEQIARREYINTEGSIWIDRVEVPNADLQRARLGGVALVRNSTYPGHAVSWAFEAPANAESVAILVPRATPRALEVVVYNLETRPVRATMTTWNVEPGRWELVQGRDSNDDDAPDRDLTRTVVDVERGAGLAITLPARATTVLRLRLLERGVAYDARPDLGIGRSDVTVDGSRLAVRVHSLGAVPAAPARVVFRDRAGRVRAAAALPELPPPLDLLPRTADVALALPPGVATAGGSVEVDPDGRLREITRRNNVVRM